MKTWKRAKIKQNNKKRVGIMHLDSDTEKFSSRNGKTDGEKKKANRNLMVLVAAWADIPPYNPLAPFPLREGKKKPPSVMARRDFGTLGCLNKWFPFLFQGNWWLSQTNPWLLWAELNGSLSKKANQEASKASSLIWGKNRKREGLFRGTATTAARPGDCSTGDVINEVYFKRPYKFSC